MSYWQRLIIEKLITWLIILWLITWKMWNVITYLSKIGWNFIFLFIPDHMWATWNKHKCLYNAWMFLPLPCNYVYPLHTSCARVCLMSSLMDGRIPLLSYQINQMVNIIPNNLNLLYILKEYLPWQRKMDNVHTFQI